MVLRHSGRGLRCGKREPRAAPTVVDHAAPQLLAVATALPRHVVTPGATKDLVRSLATASPERWTAMVEASRIRSRHSVLPIDEVMRRRSVGERSEDYAREVVELA